VCKNIKASSFIKSSDCGARDAEEALPRDFESLILPPNIHYYRIHESKWETLQAFLGAAACALAEQQKCRQQPQNGNFSPVELTSLQTQQQYHTCDRDNFNFPYFSSSNTSENFSGATSITATATRPSSLLVNRCMAIAEKVCPPTASSITAFLGHAQLQRLLNPSLPHPFYRFVRYILTLILSIGAAFLGIWILRVLMFAFGAAVCTASDATIRLFGVVQNETICVPMVPDTYALPVGFALVGLYISIQISVIAGVKIRHVLLKWDEEAFHAIGAWFLVCLGYTVFVYFARYLLTVLVSCLVPFSPHGDLDGCLPSISNPCE
jgi:hypothetical protein